MPYVALADLPPPVRALTRVKQRVWRATFNDAIKKQLPEVQAFAYAWLAVKQHNKGKKMTTVKKEYTASILKGMLNEEKRVAYYILSEVTKEDATTEIMDLQNHTVSPSEVENASWEFMENSRVLGNRHKDFAGVGSVVSSLVLTKELQQALGIKDAMPVRWVVGVRVKRDDVWASVKSGDLDAASIGGEAELEEIP